MRNYDADGYDKNGYLKNRGNDWDGNVIYCFQMQSLTAMAL